MRSASQAHRRSVAPPCAAWKARASVALRARSRRIAKQVATSSHQSLRVGDTQRCARPSHRLVSASAKLNVCGPTTVGVPTAIGLDQVLPAERQEAAADERHVARGVVRKELAERVAEHEPNAAGNCNVRVGRT